MSVNKAKTPTKDGKCWFFRVPYRDEFNTIKQYNSKKYATRAEAKEAELEYLNKLKENTQFKFFLKNSLYFSNHVSIILSSSLLKSLKLI